MKQENIETEETFLLKRIFNFCQVHSAVIIGGHINKNYDNLAKVLGLSEIIHVPHDNKLKRVRSRIHETIRKVELVIALPYKHYELDVYIKEALKEYPRPLVYTSGGDGASHIIESLYRKRAGLERILENGYGEI